MRVPDARHTKMAHRRCSDMRTLDAVPTVRRWRSGDRQAVRNWRSSRRSAARSIPSIQCSKARGNSAGGLQGRREGPREGYALLDALRARGDKTPLFFYAGSNKPEHKQETREHGGQGCTNDGQELFEMVTEIIFRPRQGRDASSINLRQPLGTRTRSS